MSREGLRYGWTTGACATAATTAAYTALLTGEFPDPVRIDLPNDKHPAFDTVYTYLLELCRADGELVHEGAFEWEWRPDGFERLW